MSSDGILTIATCFGGYEEPYLGRWIASLRDLHICSDSPCVLFLDNSLSVPFHEVLMDASRSIPGYVRVVDERLRVADPQELWRHRTERDGKWNVHTAADFTSRRDIQVSLMYQRIRNELEAWHGPQVMRWVLLLESDVLLPPDAYWRLREAMEDAWAVGLCSAMIPYETDIGRRIRPMAWRMPELRTQDRLAPEPQPDPVVWYDPPAGDFDGPEIVDAVPFGCALLRLGTMLDLPIRSTWPPVQGYGFDQIFCRDLREKLGLFCMVHWGVRAGHMKMLMDGSYADLRDVHLAP